MNLLVRIPMKQKMNALCLPLGAIQTNETQDEFWVMKLSGDSVALRVPITVGSQNDSLKETAFTTFLELACKSSFVFFTGFRSGSFNL